jgi:hypothetical protein
MTVLTWDGVGTRFYETGVDHGVLYLPNGSGVYDNGVAWNGLVSVTESPSGAEATATYADNIKYLNLISAEEFSATIACYTYPDEFQQFDGLASPSPGVVVGQQARLPFGLSYRTRKGNDLEGDAFGYKLHLAYGLTAAPSEKAYNTVNDSPEAIELSYEVSSIPTAVTGLRPTSLLVIDSTTVDADALTAIELILYGDVAVDPALPTPDEILAILDGTFTVTAVPTAPSYNSSTDVITIPSITGVQYFIDDELVAAGPTAPISANTLVVARPAPGYVFPAGVDDDWLIVFA